MTENNIIPYIRSKEKYIVRVYLSEYVAISTGYAVISSR